MPVASAVTIFTVQSMFKSLMYNKVYSWVKEEKDLALKKDKAGKAITHLAKSIYFLTATIAGTVVL